VIAFGEREVVELVESVWSTVLGWEAFPACAPIANDGDEALTGCVAITGAWTGNVLLHCEAAHARAAAAQMFGLQDGEVPLELVRDALGELTNIVGGNLKALFGGRCYLGLPSVTDGSDYAIRVPNSRTAIRVPFTSNGQALAVEVAESVEQPTHSPEANGPRVEMAPPGRG
jgi:chemotaxis protein CheX